MKKTMIAGAMLLACAMPANAAQEYDRSLERAVMKIVAEKIGTVADNLRGTFAANEAPEFSAPVAREDASRSDSDHGWTDGLARAIEPARNLSSVRIDRIVLTGSVIAQ